MKKLIFLLLKYGMRFIYFFMKLLIPVCDKAVFLSRQSDKPSENFLLLRDELKRVSPSTKCEFYCRLGLKSEMGLSYALLMLRHPHQYSASQETAACGADMAFHGCRQKIRLADGGQAGGYILRHRTHYGYAQRI